MRTEASKWPPIFMVLHKVYGKLENIQEVGTHQPLHSPETSQIAIRGQFVIDLGLNLLCPVSVDCILYLMARRSLVLRSNACRPRSPIYQSQSPTASNRAPQLQCFVSFHTQHSHNLLIFVFCFTLEPVFNTFSIHGHGGNSNKDV